MCERSLHYSSRRGRPVRAFGEQMAISAIPEGTVTILFTDVEGSTELVMRKGDDTGRRLLRDIETVIRHEVEDHSGRNIKDLGDGSMVVFTSARKAISCAIAIQRTLKKMRMRRPEIPRVRIGLNSGEVVSDGADVFGSAVSVAARVTDKAAGDEIVIAEVVKVLAGTIPGLELVEKGRFRLKGFEERWRLFEVRWEEQERVAGAGRTPFVAREDERAQLSGYLELLQRGKGALVTISGEPGVGKTRLAEELLEEARGRDFRTLTGRCYEMDSPPPYLPFVQLLEQGARDVEPETFRAALGNAAGEVAKVMPQLRTLFDDIPPPLELPPEQERRYLFNSIQEFVLRAAATRPLVVLLDDVHWADESSVLLLSHIAATLVEAPVLIVATYRDVELDAYRPLAKGLDDLVRRRLVHRISLKRLSTEGVRALLSELGRRPPPDVVVAAIHRETDGNPFFVEEVFRHLSEEGRLFDHAGQWRTDLSVDDLEVPESIRLVIGRRLQRVGEDTRKALIAAAVIGRTFSFDLLEKVVEPSGDELLDAVDEALASHLIAAAPGGSFSFIHELIRQTLLANVTLPRHQRLHVRIGEEMAGMYEGRALEDRAAEVAHHFFQAGAAADPDRTRHFLMLAGDRAMDSAAFQEALTFYGHALGLSDDLPDTDRAELLYRSGSALRSIGRKDESMRRWEDALSIYEKIGDGKKVEQIAVEAGFQLGWAGQWEEAVAVAARGLAAVGEHESLERSRLLGLAAVSLSWAGHYDAAEEMLEQAISIAERLGGEHEQGLALTAKAVHEFAYLELAAAANHAREGAELLERTGDVWSRANAMSFIVFSLLFLGRHDETREVLDELEPLGQKLGHAGAMMFSGRARAILDSGIYDWDPVIFLKRMEEDLELCRRYELPWTAQSLAFIGRARIFLGDLDEGLEQTARGAAEDPPGALWGYALGIHMLALAQVGRREEAATRLHEARAHLPVIGQTNTIGRWMLGAYFTETAAILEDRGALQAALPVFDYLVAQVDDGLSFRFDGRPFQTIAGIVYGTLGQFEQAKMHFEAATELLSSFPTHYESTENKRYFGEMLIRRGAHGDVDHARRLLSEAVAEHEHAGVPPFAELARRALKAASATVPP